MSPVPEQKPMMPAVYPRPSPMSSMYLYCAFQSSEEFSALETSFIAISFFAGAERSPAARAVALFAARGAGAAVESAGVVITRAATEAAPSAPMRTGRNFLLMGESLSAGRPWGSTAFGMADEARNSAAFRTSPSGLRVVLRRSATVAKGHGLHKRW